MKQNSLTLACLLSALVAGSATAPAITLDNPYLAPITNRNLFNLKAPPNPEDLVVKPPPPNVPNVLLTGITTIMGGKRALLRVPRPARPPEPAQEVPLILQEGAPAEEGIRVLEINIAAGTVKIDNNGTEQVLDMEKNAPKAAAVPAPGTGGVPMPVLNPRSAIPMPAPKSLPGASPASVTSIGTGRPMRATPGASSTTGMLGAGPAGLPTQSAASAHPQLSAEEQIVMMEVERERTKDKVAAGLMPPLPPTPLTPPGSPGMPTPPGVPGQTPTPPSI